MFLLTPFVFLLFADDARAGEESGEVNLLIGSVRPNYTGFVTDRIARLDSEYTEQLEALESGPQVLNNPALRNLLKARYDLQRSALQWVESRLDSRESNREEWAGPQLENEFLSQFQDYHPVEVVHDASYLDLFKALRNPNLQGLFYVSHAGNFDESPGLVSSTIVDSYGDNVQNLFKVLPQQLYWLGIIGCEAAPILKRFEEKGYYRDHIPRFVNSSALSLNPFQWGSGALHRSLIGHKGLVIDSSHRKTRALRGLRRSVNGAREPLETLAPEADSTCVSGSLIHLEVVRSSEDTNRSLSAISIGLGDYPLSIMEKNNVHSHYPLFLPWSEVEDLTDISIVIQGREGFLPWEDEEEIGKVEIWSPTLGLRWQRVEIAGRPLGRTKHVYQLDEISQSRWIELQNKDGIFLTQPCYSKPHLRMSSGGR